MSTHLTQKEFAEIVQWKKREENDHLDACTTCQEVLKLLEEAYDAANGTPPSEKVPLQTYDFHEYVEMLYSDSISSQQAADFYQSLISSPKYLQVTFNMVEDSFRPITEAELEELAVYKELSFAKKNVPIPRRKPVERIDTPVPMVDWLRDVFETLFPRPAVWVPALLVLVMMGGFGGRRLYVYYQTTRNLEMAEVELERIGIFFQNPQLSGDYFARMQDVFLAGGDDEKERLVQARAFVDQAISNGARGPRAAQILARTYILGREYAKADSVLNTLDDEALKSPLVLNDLGVAKYWLGDLILAAGLFQETIDADPDLVEAHFNLALVFKAMNRKAEAQKSIDKYLELERDEGWRKAALAAKRQIESL
jgi:tetratricopeptide (TPR) repeat protein